jgi:hypothetical protein
MGHVWMIFISCIARRMMESLGIRDGVKGYHI